MEFARKCWLALVAVAGIAALTVAGAAPASAQNATFDFTYSGPGVSASGVLDTTLVSGTTDEWYVTGISGQRNGQTITGLVTPVPNPPGTSLYDPSSSAPDWINYDDLVFFPGTPSLDSAGIYFTTTGDSYNVFSSGSTYQDIDGTAWIANGTPPSTTLSNFTLTLTPESSSLALLLPSALLLAGFALFARRRRSRNA